MPRARSNAPLATGSPTSTELTRRHGHGSDAGHHRRHARSPRASAATSSPTSRPRLGVVSPLTPRRRRRCPPPPSSPTAREPTRRSTPRSPRPRSLDSHRLWRPWSRPTLAAARRTRASSPRARAWRVAAPRPRFFRSPPPRTRADSSSESKPIFFTDHPVIPENVTRRRAHPCQRAPSSRFAPRASRAREEIFFPPCTEEYSVADARARPSDRWARTLTRMTSKTMKTTTISGRAPRSRSPTRRRRSPPPLSRRCSSPRFDERG